MWGTTPEANINEEQIPLVDERKIRSSLTSLTDEEEYVDVSNESIRNTSGDDATSISRFSLSYAEREEAKRATRSHCWMYFWMCFLTGLTPVLIQKVLTNSTTGEREMKFRAQFPYVIAYANVIFVSLCVSIWEYGWRKGLTGCFQWSRVLVWSPVSCFTASSDALKIPTLMYLDASPRAIINQIRVPLVPVARKAVLGAPQTILQWVLIAGITGAVTGYLISNEPSAANASIALGRVSYFEEMFSPGVVKMLKGILLAFISITATVSAGLVAETRFSRTRQSFWFEIFHLRSTTLLFLLILLVGHAIYDNDFLAVYTARGVTWKVIVLGLGLSVRDIVLIHFLRETNTLWVSFSNVGSLCVTFVASCIFLDGEIRIVPAIFVSNVICCLTAYALTKRPFNVRSRFFEVQKNLSEIYKNSARSPTFGAVHYS